MEDSSKKKASITRKNNKHNVEKPKGFHEASPVAQKSPRNSYDVEAYPISFHGSSVFWDSDSNFGSNTTEKKAYPLPQPSASCRSSMESNQRVSSFGSERVSLSSSRSYESWDDDDIHGDFSSFRCVAYIVKFLKFLVFNLFDLLFCFGVCHKDMIISLRHEVVRTCYSILFPFSDKGNKKVRRMNFGYMLYSPINFQPILV